MTTPTLRARVLAAIQAHPNDPEKAAIAVCVALEERIDLQGNGWFDDDPVMIDALDAHGANPPETAPAG